PATRRRVNSRFMQEILSFPGSKNSLREASHALAFFPNAAWRIGQRWMCSTEALGPGTLPVRAGSYLKPMAGECQGVNGGRWTVDGGRKKQDPRTAPRVFSVFSPSTVHRSLSTTDD